MSKDNFYKIDFRKWALLLLPTPLRKSALYHFIYVLLVPLVRIYRSFAQRRMTDNFYAKYDCSVGNLERMLNTLFPSDEGVIIVWSAETSEVVVDSVYVTTSHVSGSAYVGESYIDKTRSQQLFTVQIPGDLEGKKQQITDVVNKYTLPGYLFNVEQYAED